MIEVRDIQEIPLSSPYFRSRVERFLESNGLRIEPLDAYYAFTDESGELMAGAGIARDVLKCLAVSAEVRSEGLLVPLVSRILSEHPEPLKVFTKPEYQAVFESLGFHLLAQAPLAILLEKGKGLEQYCEYLKGFRRPGRSGVIVMNANPFTLGHLYLIQEASRQVDTLFVIPVKEDVSEFPYAERCAMIKAGIAATAPAGPAAKENYFSQGFAKNQFSSAIATPTHVGAVVVLEGSDYVISSATFPTYFLKDLSTVSETQMRLDLDLYSRWIAPALGASVRFVGSEPFDELTERYNELIPNAVLIPRLSISSHSNTPCHSERSEESFSSFIATPTHKEAISASAVRRALAAGRFKAAAEMCPVTTWPYLLAALAERALLRELDTPCKPGLVGPDGPGAHRDMDYAVMRRGIAALRPFWSRMTVAGSPEELRQQGMEAEAAMMKATNGVNTHRGAIFALGLALNAFGRFYQLAYNEQVMQNALGEIARSIFDNQLKDNTLTKTPLQGARYIAAAGYQELFEDWLPYYKTEKGLCACEAKEPVVFSGASAQTVETETGLCACEAKGPVGFSGASAHSFATEKSTPFAEAEQKTLLRIMSTLDDTCVVHRVGQERAEQVKKEAENLLRNFSEEKLKDLCVRYAAEGISPGGAADMLSLTIFMNSIL